MRRDSGNGETKFSIGQHDLGGRVRVFLESGHAPPDLPVYLAQVLSDWFRNKPGLRLTSVTPICKDGNTVELYGWYEAHIFPSTTSAPQGREVGS